MIIDYDPDKDELNNAKHGLSLKLAAELDWDTALAWVDTRFPYNETRMVALAPRGNHLYCVIFVDKNECLRIISLRKAERPEIDYYVENFR